MLGFLYKPGSDSLSGRLHGGSSILAPRGTEMAPPPLPCFPLLPRRACWCSLQNGGGVKGGDESLASAAGLVPGQCFPPGWRRIECSFKGKGFLYI